MTRLAAIAAAIALVTLPAVARAAGPAAVLRAEPAAVRFGDPLVLEAIVRLPAAPDAVVLLDPAPFTALAAPTTRTRSEGGATVVTVRQRVACLDRGCLPDATARLVPTGAVSVRSADTVSPVPTRAAVVRVVPRVPAGVVAERDGGFKASTRPPRPTYALSPGTGTAILSVGAVLALLLAAGLVWPDLRRRVARRRGADDVDPFARAVRLLRESAARGADDRRRAAGLVARLLAKCRRRRPLARGVDARLGSSRARPGGRGRAGRRGGWDRHGRTGQALVSRIPLADVAALAGQALRTRVVRWLLVAALAGLAAVLLLTAFRLRPPTTAFLPRGTNGVVVLDVSASISTDHYARITSTLKQIASSRGRYGLVVFSDVAYQALPPGTRRRSSGRTSGSST